MSFTSRDLRGQFHTFTSPPLVHTSNPDFFRWRLWLGLLLIPEASFMQILIHQGLRIWDSLIFPKFASSWLHRFVRFPKFADSWLIDFIKFHSPWNRQSICNPKVNSVIISHDVREFTNCAKSALLLHEYFHVTKQTFRPDVHSRKHSQIWYFKGWTVFAQIPKKKLTKYLSEIDLSTTENCEFTGLVFAINILLCGTYDFVACLGPDTW
jgi:hypothetical protein